MSEQGRSDYRRRRRVIEIRRAIGAELRRIRDDAGIRQSRVAKAAGISAAHLSGIESGDREASTGVLVAVADVLGADLSVRLYPTTGPRIRDRFQAGIVEALLSMLHATWRPSLEVAVRQPARGVIDVVLYRPAQAVVAVEVESELRRVEQEVRWANQKRESLPSSDLWRFVDTSIPVSSLLVLRSTARTRELVRAFPETIATTYPAATRDLFEALTGDAPWPGSGLLWAEVDGGRARILERPPRGVLVGT